MVENKTTEVIENKPLDNMADDKVHQQLFGI
jgi:hypothetical protein